MKTFFDQARPYCSNRTTVNPERSYFLNICKNCGYPLHFIARLMRYKNPQAHGQMKHSTPEETPEHQRTSRDSEPRWVSLLCINGISLALARHLRSGTQAYVHRDASQTHHTEGCIGRHDLHIPVQRVLLQTCL